ncbi:hypothetical protein [Lacrimispora sp.]|uniref:hypothetical protein n=1 Tax=Lacrimispora sp. TaxID=2719234 RepID=UPI0028B1203E|nr:hypothetical protein [Lacrimispora sp.]
MKINENMNLFERNDINTNQYRLLPMIDEALRLYEKREEKHVNMIFISSCIVFLCIFFVVVL